MTETADCLKLQIFFISQLHFLVPPLDFSNLNYSHHALVSSQRKRLAFEKCLLERYFLNRLEIPSVITLNTTRNDQELQETHSSINLLLFVQLSFANYIPDVEKTRFI